MPIERITIDSSDPAVAKWERDRYLALRKIRTPANTVQPETMLTPKAFGQRLGVSRSTLYRLLESGRVKTFRFGRLIRIPASEVDRLVN